MPWPDLTVSWGAEKIGSTQSQIAASKQENAYTIQGKGGGTREQHTYSRSFHTGGGTGQVAWLSVHQVAIRVMAVQEGAFAGDGGCFHGGSIINS